MDNYYKTGEKWVGRVNETGDIKVNETVDEMLNERGKMRWNS